MNDFFGISRITNDQAKMEATKLSMAPFVFQATLALRDFGILKIIESGGKEGIKKEKIYKEIDLSNYAIDVLLDAGVSIGLFIFENDLYILTNLGYFVLNDIITNINFNFTQDVNYQGLYYLKDSLKNGKPEGLKVFGNWKTIYEGLSSLPENAKKSWIDFDNYYSDHSYPKILPILFKNNPQKILEIGGNTGKFSIETLKFDKTVEISIIDLPGQIEMAKKNLKENNKENNLEKRVKFYPMNVLVDSTDFPEGFDIIWMSQFLDCFSKEEIKKIIRKSKKSLNKNGSIFILETFTDLQRYKASEFCLNMTSLYFTAMANGNSRMYPYKEFKKILEEENMEIVNFYDRISISHQLIECKIKN